MKLSSSMTAIDVIRSRVVGPIVLTDTFGLSIFENLGSAFVLAKESVKGHFKGSRLRYYPQAGTAMPRPKTWKLRDELDVENDALESKSWAWELMDNRGLDTTRDEKLEDRIGTIGSV